MPSRWCPWCGAEIPGAVGSTEVTCGSCGAKTPFAASLAAAPQRPLKPDDPEAQLPPGAPEGAAPLPQGAPTMSPDALIRFAVIFLAAVLAVAVLGIAIGRPLLALFQPPAPTPAATPAPPPAATP